MDEIGQLRDAADLLLKRSQDASVAELASAVEKMTGVLRLSSDLEKSAVELRNLSLEESKLKYEVETEEKRASSDRLKDVVTLLTPMVSIIALLVTIIFQSWQFVQSEKDKNAAAEDALWTDAVKTVSQSSQLSPGVITLNPFLKSQKYHQLSRDLAVQLLANSSDTLFFTDLFGAALVPVGWSNLDQVVKLDRALAARAQPLFGRTYDAKTRRNDLRKLDSREIAIYNYAVYALPVISAQVAGVLKTPRPQGALLDLAAGRFQYSDWKGVDLSGADIHGTEFWWVDLDGANLDGITAFDQAYFTNVAWWQARKIGPALRHYLETTPASKYNPKTLYGAKFQTVSPEEYAAAVKRLDSRPQ
ncbi:MAG: hypothetical protein NVSMB64_02540 [Candidatus Velthaea sp.]